MEFGAVVQTHPPASRTVQLAELAEAHGFESLLDVRLPPAVGGALRHLQPDPGAHQAHHRRADGHQPGDPRLDRHRIRVRHAQRDVRQPHHRAASAAATRRCGSPTARRPRWRRLREVDARHPRARQLATGRVQRRDAAVPVEPRLRGLEVWVAAYGPARAQAHGRGGRRLHPAARRPRHRGVDDRRGAQAAAKDAGRDPDADQVLRRRAVLHRRRLGRHMRDQCRWFGGMVGNHVAGHRGQVRRLRCGPEGARPTTSRRARATTTPSTARPATRTPTSCPTRSSTGSASWARIRQHIAKLEALKELGGDQFAGYLQHDNKEETLRVYGDTVMPAIREAVKAKQA